MCVCVRACVCRCAIRGATFCFKVVFRTYILHHSLTHLLTFSLTHTHALPLQPRELFNTMNTHDAPPHAALSRTNKHFAQSKERRLAKQKVHHLYIERLLYLEENSYKSCVRFYCCICCLSFILLHCCVFFFSSFFV